MECQFVVGQKVQCVMEDGMGWTSQKHFPKLAYPVRNGIYTIRDMEIMTSSKFPHPDVYLRFVELINPAIMDEGLGYSQEVAFFWQQFRPLNERPTSIEIFKKLERPKTKKVPIDIKVHDGV